MNTMTENTLPNPPLQKGYPITALVVGIVNLITFSGFMLCVFVDLLLAHLMNSSNIYCIAVYMRGGFAVLPVLGLIFGCRSIRSNHPKIAIVAVILNSFALAVTIGFVLLCIFLYYNPPSLGIE
jgi:hypothetical protein